MKRLRDMIFDDPSEEEEEEDDDDLEMALMLMVNEEFRRPRRGLQFGHVTINQNRAEGHARIKRDYFSSKAIYTNK
jgi:hypothetical protein